jgi:phosphoribosyl-ATP pyrophosphohydrolase/phosphoribosyl-AMP cyclohydrolase
MLSPDIEPLIAAAKFEENGLIPVISQDRRTGVVRMFAWANRDALRATANTGLATFWSRSRKSLWEKGATSGHAMRVLDLRLDCDGDVILYVVDADGPSCHEGTTSCFSRTVQSGSLLVDDGPPAVPASIVSQVDQVIASRKGQDAGKSYVASLFAKGFPKIEEKIREEAGELCESLPTGDDAHTAHEAADLIFHAMVGLQAAGLNIDAVFAELERRFGVSGHTEKASRNKG